MSEERAALYRRLVFLLKEAGAQVTQHEGAGRSDG